MRSPTASSLEKRADLTIVHPMDPWKQGIGGFDTCIDGVLRYAPDEWTIEVIGLTAEPRERPVGRWLELPFAERTIRFFPAMAERQPGVVRRTPLVLRFVIACRLRGPRPSGKVIQIHRFESALGIRPDPDGRVVYFLHNHPEEADSAYSDVRWRRLGWLFHRLMAWKMRSAAAAVAVDPRSPAWLAGRFPWLDGVAMFLPEWADPRFFTPGSTQDRQRARHDFRRRQRLEEGAKVVAFVGRIESQKDPLFLVEAFSELRRLESRAVLALLGEGRMEGEVRERAKALGLLEHICFMPSVQREAMSDFYRAVDVLACSSRFEGGPRVVFEALASGTPAVSLDVGQVSDVLDEDMSPDIGVLVRERDPRRFAEALQRVLAAGGSAKGARRCAAAVARFTPERSLGELFELYARWIGDGRRRAGEPRP
jgi:glycosyltransferase involved in cell wall biosynthesis